MMGDRPRHRPRIAAASLIAALVALGGAATADAAPRAVKLADTQLDPTALFFVSFNGLVNNASYQQSAILSHAGFQYAAWYTANRAAIVARRRLPAGAWETVALPHQLSTNDSHNSISLGLPFENPPPYVPVDEEYDPRPETAYSLGKLVDETIARQFARWDPALKIVGLRFSNVMDVEDYKPFPSFDSDPGKRKWNLWSYIDARDGAQAVRKAIEARFTGFEAFIIANADTVMSRSNASLMADVFPGVEIRPAMSANGTLLSIDKATRLLGYQPQHRWRDHA